MLDVSVPRVILSKTKKMSNVQNMEDLRSSKSYLYIILRSYLE